MSSNNGTNFAATKFSPRDPRADARGWIGFDLDGTLAYHDPDSGFKKEVGPPVGADNDGISLLDRVRVLISQGREVKIFTARIWPLGTLEELNPKNSARVREASEQLRLIRKFCLQNLGQILEVTCIKDPTMYKIVDDRAVTVERNTSRILAQPPDDEDI